VAALRVDKNDQVEGVQSSPRAAVIFKPNETHNFRLTYNRAFQTPANFTWFLDLISSAGVAGPSLPYNIRALGNPPKTGWTFNRTCNANVNGGLCMRSIFTPDSSAWVAAGAHAAYPGVIFGNRVAIAAALVPAITNGLMAAPFNMPQAQASGAANILAPAIVGILASQQPTAAQVGSEMRMIAPGSPVLTAANVRDIGPIKASFNNTYELGYKGIIGSKVRLSVDLWREKRGDVGNPAGLATPNIFFDRTSLQTFMSTALAPQLADTMRVRLGFSQQQAAAAAAGFSPLIAGQISGTFAPLPLGIVSFNSPTFASASDIYATYTSFDTTITVNGIDLAVDFVANTNWTFGATMSWVDNDSFPEVKSSNNRALMLNAPSNKVSASALYRSTSSGWGFDGRVRHTNAYPVNSGVYATGVDYRDANTGLTYRYDDIESATILDVGLNWRFLQGGRDFLFSVRADNVLNEKYRTMPGTPALGTMVITRLQYSFR
jgi:outer membrane receptor for ferrienterochelin and colicins